MEWVLESIVGSCEESVMPSEIVQCGLEILILPKTEIGEVQCPPWNSFSFKDIKECSKKTGVVSNVSSNRQVDKIGCEKRPRCVDVIEEQTGGDCKQEKEEESQREDGMKPFSELKSKIISGNFERRNCWTSENMDPDEDLEEARNKSTFDCGSF